MTSRAVPKARRAPPAAPPSLPRRSCTEASLAGSEALSGKRRSNAVGVRLADARIHDFFAEAEAAR